MKLPEIEFGRYHGLVIGNNDYQHLRKLNTAVSDAEAVAMLLEETGARFNLADRLRLNFGSGFRTYRSRSTEKPRLVFSALALWDPFSRHDPR